MQQLYIRVPTAKIERQKWEKTALFRGKESLNCNRSIRKGKSSTCYSYCHRTFGGNL